MITRVVYYGLMQTITKRREDEVEHEGSITVRELLKELVGRHGERFQEAVFERSNRLAGYVRIILGEEELSQEDGLEQKIGDNRKVSIVVLLPSSMGG